MTGASGNVKVISTTIIVVALIAALVYTAQSPSPNAALIVSLLTSTLAGLMAYLKAGKVEQVQQEQVTVQAEIQATQAEIQETVNGNLARAEGLAGEALSALPPAQGQEVLRRVDQDPPEPPPVR